MDKAAVFIDGGYLSRVLKSEGSPRVDYLKLSEQLCDGFMRLRTYYYTCMPFQSSPVTKEESERYARADRFVSNLKALPRFEIRLGRLQKLQNGNGGYTFSQKGVDVNLAVDLVKMSWDKQIQKAVVIASDSDFVYAVQAAKDAGVLTQLVYSPNAPMNASLRDVFDERFLLSRNILDDCKLE